MPFQNELLGWNAPGVEPPQSLKDTGWEAQQKPPAPYFNWTFHMLDQALLELQQNALHKDQGGVAGGFATLGPDGKVPANQLSISAPADASTTQKGIVQLNDNIDSTSITQAATANAIRKVAENAATHQAEDATDAHNASNISVADANNRFTGTNVETVLNELFQFANNGKTDIASVIGSPATSGDSFSQLKTHIQDRKNELATNLSAKGQASAGTETLDALVDKVALVNTGVKKASGTVTSGTSFSNYQYAATTATKSFVSVTVTGIPFKPKHIVLYGNTTGSARFLIEYSEGTDTYYPKTVKVAVFTGDTISTAVYNLKGDVLTANVAEGTFTLPVNGVSQLHTWIAYEE